MSPPDQGLSTKIDTLLLDGSLDQCLPMKIDTLLPVDKAGIWGWITRVGCSMHATSLSAHRAEKLFNGDRG